MTGNSHPSFAPGQPPDGTPPHVETIAADGDDDHNGKRALWVDGRIIRPSIDCRLPNGQYATHPPLKPPVRWDDRPKLFDEEAA